MLVLEERKGENQFVRGVVNILVIQPRKMVENESLILFSRKKTQASLKPPKRTHLQ